MAIFIACIGLVVYLTVFLSLARFSFLAIDVPRAKLSGLVFVFL